MAVIGWVDEEDVAEATKWTGDPEVDPGAGELTVTPANEAPARPRVVISNRIAFFTALYSFGGRFLSLEEQRVRSDLLWIHRDRS
jgi:hypothetical protein